MVNRVFVGLAAIVVLGAMLQYVISSSARVSVMALAASSRPIIISRAPAFSDSQLSSEPTSNWITNGGSLTNERYSPLSEITTANVSQVKGVWLTHLRHSAVDAKYSAEGQPIEYDGVIYIPTGQDDVFAITADTGRILWEHQAHLDPQISVICCGWLSRGVALGDGKIYIGQLDGKLVALDQTTGYIVWSRQVERWQDGYSITSAPLYIDGMVITGIAGAENGTRGRVTAYDASTGKQVWQFFTVPGPGQVGHATWPAAGTAWQRGGATVWQTPSVDAKLGLLYFTTGNAGPDNDGSKRAGMNLFSASVVALQVKTGKLQWYFQMVHHDLWDYDAASPTVLFDVTIRGRLVHGIAEAEKTGWVYLLDRTDGKPIFPIPERPVPQNAFQKTWPTQPVPSMDALVPHELTVSQAHLVAETAAEDAGRPVKMIAAGQIFTPYWKTLTAVTPGPQGGTNWQPSSYDPATHMIYVCAQNGLAALSAETLELQERKRGAAQPEQWGSELVQVGGFGRNAGVFSAIDVSTGRIAWQKHFADSCYSGSTATAGDLVFVGRNAGELQAYNARSGALLWSFQTGAGANDVPTIFQGADGHEYVAFFAGGNALAATPHGDSLWLLGLDGKLGPETPPGVGTGIEHAGAAMAKPAPREAPNAIAGAVVFAANCAVCHGATGLGGNGGPNIARIPATKSQRAVISQVTNGGGGMPAFKGVLTEKQVDDVSAYVVQRIANGPK
jgi:quinohemoprotein ethanol dehydrogenase